MRHLLHTYQLLEGQLCAKAGLERPLVATLSLAGLAWKRAFRWPPGEPGFWAEASTSWPELTRPGPEDPTYAFWWTKAAN